MKGGGGHCPLLRDQLRPGENTAIFVEEEEDQMTLDVPPSVSTQPGAANSLPKHALTLAKEEKTGCSDEAAAGTPTFAAN